MNITKILGLALIVVGAVLIFFGFNQTGSPLGEMSEALTGSYSDETMQFLIGGAVAVVIGLFLAYKR
jgi:drug/metabolite transporter (DMT)-like permease